MITRYKLDSAATTLGLFDVMKDPVRWLTAEIKAGRIPGKKIGRHWTMTRAEMDAAEQSWSASISALDNDPRRDGCGRTVLERNGFSARSEAGRGAATHWTLGGVGPQEVRMSNVVYRAFNADNEVLYVGVTADPYQRFAFHEYQTRWWHLVDRVELSQEFEDRREAEQAEARAISEMEPAFNRHYPLFTQDAPTVEFSPFDYKPTPNMPAALRSLNALAPDAQRAAMELAFKPITDGLNPEEPRSA